MHHMYQQQHNKYIEFKAIKRPRHTFSLALGSAGARMAYFCLPQAALTHLKFLLHIWRCTSAEQQASLVQISWLSQLNLSKQCAIYRCGNTYGHWNSKFSTLYSNYGSRQNGCIHVHKISQYFSRSDAAIKPRENAYNCIKPEYFHSVQMLRRRKISHTEHVRWLHIFWPEKIAGVDKTVHFGVRVVPTHQLPNPKDSER